jgi:hypothetical protein
VSKAARIRAAVSSPFRVFIPPQVPLAEDRGTCGGIAEWAARPVLPACFYHCGDRGRLHSASGGSTGVPAGFAGTPVESDRHLFVARARPGKRRRRGASHLVPDLAGRARAARRRWGLAVRPRGGRARPLMSRCAERRTEGGPKAWSRRDGAQRPERRTGPSGPSMRRIMGLLAISSTTKRVPSRANQSPLEQLQW